MADIIAVAGDTGSGKTTAVRTLNPKETMVISILGKALPFQGSKKHYIPFVKGENGFEGNFFKSNSIDNISKVFDIINLKRLEIKQIVIDDSNYLMACEVMDRSEEKGYDKHVQIAKHYYQLITKAAALRDDLKVIFLSHVENIGDILNPKLKLKTAGK